MTRVAPRAHVSNDPRPEVLLARAPILTDHFDAGPGYACKRAGGTDDWLLFCVVGGAGAFRHRGGELLATPGDLILLPPRRAQDYRTAEAPPARWEFTWAHFRPLPHWLPLLGWPESAPGVLGLRPPAAAFAGLAAQVRAVHELATGGRHHRHALALNALEALLLRLDEHNALSPAHRDGRLDPRLRATIDRVCRDLAHPWDVAALAELAGLSPSRFAHAFRQAVGASPRTFIERQRIERARHLLTATDLPVQAVAAAVGFADPFHFSRRFHALTGSAPRTVRATTGPGEAG